MKRTIATIALAGIAGLGVAACSSGSDHKSAPASQDAQTDTPTTTYTPPAPPTTATLHDRMASWAITSGVSTKLGTLSTKLTDVSTAAYAHDVPQLDTAAYALQAEIATDRDALTSSPDPALNALIGGALDHFNTAAGDVITNQYSSATSELNAGTSQINQAATMVRSY